MHLPHSREADQYCTEAWTLLKLVIPWLFLQGYQRVSPSVSVFVHWQSRAEVRRVSSPTDLLMSLIDNPRQCRALTLVSCTDCHCKLWERKWNQCWLWLDESHNLPGAWWTSSTSWCLLRRRCSIKAVRSSLAHRVLTSKLQNVATSTCWQLNIIERFCFVYIFPEMLCDYPPTVTHALYSWQMVDAL